MRPTQYHGVGRFGHGTFVTPGRDLGQVYARIDSHSRIAADFFHADAQQPGPHQKQFGSAVIALVVGSHHYFMNHRYLKAFLLVPLYWNLRRYMVGHTLAISH